jgi:glycosyltransferase involved in cell wall biosynthesis
MLLFLFWFLALASIYSYFIYPLILMAVKKYRGGKNISAAELDPQSAPGISLIVTAYNEERRIREKIENSLSLDYDKRKLEIIVASDCSDDLTDDIVLEYADRGIKLVRAQERLGKENAQLAAIREAKGDILIFSDTATQIPEDALWKMVAYFADPEIGAVSSEDRFISKDGTVAGEGAYVKYEMWLRRQESELSGLVGLSGSFFAARKTICQDWDIHSPSDFNTALNAAKAGLRAISASDVLGFYTDLQDPAKEYQRKIRTVIRGMTGLSRHAEVMNLTKFGFFAIQVISHKLMRWLSPLFFIFFFLISAVLANDGFFYGLVFIGQLAFYGAALVAHFLPGLRRLALVKLVYFFVQVHVALFDATLKFLAGQRMTTWKPSAR